MVGWWGGGGGGRVVVGGGGVRLLYLYRYRVQSSSMPTLYDFNVYSQVKFRLLISQYISGCRWMCRH